MSGNSVQYIQVWRFQDAPTHLQKLSDNGGDEDWLARIPAEMGLDEIPWIDYGPHFGCFNIQTVTMEDGDIITIGSHS